MPEIVPSKSWYTTQQVLRRPNTRRSVRLCLLFVVLCAGSIFLRLSAAPANALLLRLAGILLGALATGAALAAIVFRLTEAPREVTLRTRHEIWSTVIHVKGNE